MLLLRLLPLLLLGGKAGQKFDLQLKASRPAAEAWAGVKIQYGSLREGDGKQQTGREDGGG